MRREFTVWDHTDENGLILRYSVCDAMTPEEEDEDHPHYREPIAMFTVSPTHGALEQVALAHKLCDYLNDCLEKTALATELLDL